MSAKNPFRVSDLIAKYGWKIMPYLSNLGPQLLAEAQVLFVDSGHTNALDADDTEHGHSFEKPLATIDYAIGLCTAGEGSIIFAAPGHNEELGDAQIDFDVSDITCMGIGEGTNKPRIDFDHANSSVNIGANNIHIINITFMPSITDILIGVDVEAAVTGTILEKCAWVEGEDAADEFILGVDVKAGCDNTKITNCLGRTKVASAGAVSAVNFTGASDNCIVEKCRFIGNYSTAAIVNETAACTDLLIDDLTCKVKDGEPGIEVHTNCTGIIRNVCIESTGTTVDSMIVADRMSWFNNFGVTADGEASAVIGGGEVQAALNTAVPNTPTAKSLNDILSKLDGANTFDNTTDSLEAIADAIAAVEANVSAAVDEPPVAKSLHDILHKDGSFNYDNTSDSLEAISDAVGAISSPTDVTNAVPEPPIAKSLQDILHKDTSYTYSKTDHSLEAIGDDADAIIVDIATAQTELDKIGTVVNTAGTATIGGVFGDFANSSLVARLGIITDDTAAIEPGVKRLVSTITTDWNLTADNGMFTVSGLVKAKIWGEVLVIVKNTTMLLQVIATATSPGSAPIDVTANLDCDQDAAGTVYKLATTIGGAMVATTGGVSADDSIDVILPPGVVELGSGANEDGGGSIQWFCQYEPLEAGATVTAT